jgi:hypothetical protein
METLKPPFFTRLFSTLIHNDTALEQGNMVTSKMALHDYCGSNCLPWVRVIRKAVAEN